MAELQLPGGMQVVQPSPEAQSLQMIALFMEVMVRHVVLGHTGEQIQRDMGLEFRSRGGDAE